MKKPALSSLTFLKSAFPHPVEQDEIHIPRSLLYLSVSSMVISFILLIVSLCDLGYCSLWLTPPVCLFTLLYFTGVLFLSRRERTEEDPTYFPTVVLIGYIMTILWLVAFILTIVVFAVYPHIVEALAYHGLHSVTVGLQRFECILCITNLGLVGWFTARAHIIAMQDGNPDHWRILVEKSENGTKTRQIRVQHQHNLNDPTGISEPRDAPLAPTAHPDWVTAAVLEDDMEAARKPKLPYPQIEVSAASEEEDVYDEVEISDYYEDHNEKDGGGHFRAEDLYDDLYRQSEKEHVDRSPHHSSYPHPSSSDGDSIYEDQDERWTDEEEVIDEYNHTRSPPRTPRY